MGCFGEDSSDEVDQPMKNISKNRSCTDVFWLAIFIIFWIFMVLIAAFSLIYGHPVRLLNGYDSFGNTCGVKKNAKMGDLPLSGIDTSDKPYLFYLDVSDLAKSLQICVKQCPDKELATLKDLKEFYDKTGSSLCQYDFNLTTLNTNDDHTAISKTFGPCPVLPVSRSVSVLHRCVPKEATNLVKGVSKKLYKVLNSWDVAEQALSDVHSSWGIILILTCGAFLLSLLVVAFLHFAVSTVAWIIMIAVSVACTVGTCLLWWAYIDAKWDVSSALSKSEPILDKVARNSTALLVYAIIATLFTIIILLLVFVMRKRISLMAQLFKESSECLGDLPYLFFQPFVIFAALLAFFAFWMTVVVCLATAAYPISKSVMPLGTGNETSAVITTNSSGKGSAFKPLKYIDFDDAGWIKCMFWYYFIGLIWTSEFILACEQMVISGAVAAWYFDGNRSASAAPVKTSVSNLLSYHLGSVALGSFLITILKVPRIILSYLYTKMKKNEETSQCAQCGLKCCICCFYCLEKCVRFMNNNAYTVIAVQGTNFCSAARRAFTIMVSNALQLATINSVGDFILFLGKCFVTAVTGSVALVLLKRDTSLKFYAIPTLVIAIFAFFVAHCVLSLYETVIDTLFLCMCEDQSINPDEGKWKKSQVVEQYQAQLRKDEENQQAAPVELAPINSN